MSPEKVSLVIFTCEGREYLLHDTYNSFKKACDYPFSKTILAIDGNVDAAITNHIQPGIVVQSPARQGYIHNIFRALKMVDTPYFFWLEDDWQFDAKADLEPFINLLKEHSNWTQILYSKFGPLDDELKQKPVSADLYETTYGFSANPCICRTAVLKDAFDHLQAAADQGDQLAEEGFEYFISRYLSQKGMISLIQDPVDHNMISHQGYLESTPRNWHLTNTINQKAEKHHLTIPAPSIGRKLLMALRLIGVFPKLAVKQLANNEIYELCFRILASEKLSRKK
jgi:hypothetical protein